MGQDDLYIEACNINDFNNQINTLIEDYNSTRQIDTSTDGALASASALSTAIDEAYQTCLDIQQEARLETLDNLLKDLRRGGYILYMRHTHTARESMGDTEREGCESERNLSTRGRAEAEAISVAYEELDLPISATISTELCRTRDTTDLAFGGQTEIITLSQLEQSLADVLAIQPEARTNTIIVAHIGTLSGVIELPIPFEEGDTYVFQPMGDDGFELIGRIALLDWALLADINAD